MKENMSLFTNPDLPNFSDREKEIHHRLVQRYIDFFKEYNNDNISVIPAYLNIDTYLGYRRYSNQFIQIISATVKLHNRYTDG
jgi:hypothetical protein